ncbi:hypothetical protein E2C01_083165 [Portunus trituberculatus]|uniref:Uncharacterized protein n=1 Tax=Portunus trituberculatus TaxID=210409 RepID=A0A5B7J0F7_PORTR|nr:hypothetical protein [Portunus trituberculatus]
MFTNCQKFRRYYQNRQDTTLGHRRRRPWSASPLSPKQALPQPPNTA